jgi:thioredoxin-like negative regulator of GroEL
MPDAKTVSPLAEKALLLREAVVALEHGHLERAREFCARILARRPDDTEATYLLGLALGAMGRHAPAANLLHLVHVKRPDVSHPVLDLVGRLRRLGRASDIVPQLRASLGLAPGNVGISLVLADQLCESGVAAAAAEVLDPVLRSQPDCARARLLMGIICHDLGMLTVAMAHFLGAAGLLPDAAAPWSNIGLLEKIEGRFTESLAAYDQALRRDPDDPRIRLNRAIALLRAGRMREAWADYECRFRVDGRTPPFPMTRLLPDLPGGVSLAGRTVLLTHEDGFGDTIQFVRYAGLLAGRGGRVVLRVPPQLRRLLLTAPGVTEVVGNDVVIPQYDFFCPMFSLPRAFGTTLESIPADIPYLRADPSLVTRWASRLQPCRGTRVGLVWAGQARPWAEGFSALDNRRSIGLAALAPLASVPGLQLVSLQSGAPAAEVSDPAHGVALIDVMGEVVDFADTAAIIANLDVVVSVDTSVAHLAGAMGKPVFLLDRYDSCWRWLAGRDDSPWYPSLRIFRQTRMGDWAPVVARVAAALADLAAATQDSGNGDAAAGARAARACSGRGMRSVSSS